MERLEPFDVPPPAGRSPPVRRMPRQPSGGRRHAVAYETRFWTPFRRGLLLAVTLVGGLSYGAWHEHFDLRSMQHSLADFGSASLTFKTHQSAYADARGRQHALLSVAGKIGSDGARVLAAALDAAALHPGDAVALSSPGGDLFQGIAMGSEIRSRGLNAFVAEFDEDGGFRPAQCASSCVMALAGGVSRIVVDGSAIGVHQFTVDPASSASADPGSIQRASGRILAHLEAMGVSSGLLEAASWSTDIRWLTDDEAAELGIETMTYPRS